MWVMGKGDQINIQDENWAFSQNGYKVPNKQPPNLDLNVLADIISNQTRTLNREAIVDLVFRMCHGLKICARK